MSDDELPPDPLAALLRWTVVAHDVDPARAAAVRTAARAALREAVKPYRRTRRAIETTATFALGACQMVWMLTTLFAK